MIRPTHPARRGRAFRGSRFGFDRADPLDGNNIQRHAARSRDLRQTAARVSRSDVSAVVLAEGAIVGIADDLPEFVEGFPVVRFALAVEICQDEPHRQRAAHRLLPRNVNDLVERAYSFEDEMLTVESHPGFVERKWNARQWPMKLILFS